MNPVYICIPTTKERRPRLEKCIESIHENAGYPHVICTYENFQEGFIGPIHKILSGLKPDTLVWCIGDDTIVSMPNTLDLLVKLFNHRFPNKDGVIEPDDGIQCGQIAVMPFCTAYTMAKYTFKGYFLNYADNEFTQILRSKGLYAYVPEIKVDHQHWVNKKAPLDETYKHSQSKFQADQELFMQRLKNNFQPQNE
jgi:hypothetical protein